MVHAPAAGFMAGTADLQEDMESKTEKMDSATPACVKQRSDLAVRQYCLWVTWLPHGNIACGQHINQPRRTTK